MEDAATAEICRSQVWQWLKHGAALSDGRAITQELVKEVIDEELQQMRDQFGAARFESGKFDLAARVFEQITTSAEFPEFMTLAAYEHID
jgi:malate synthase